MQFPSIPASLNVWENKVHELLILDKVFYRYDTQPDTLLFTRNIFDETPCAIDRDPETGKLYFFFTNMKHGLIFSPGNEKPDSISFGKQMLMRVCKSNTDKQFYVQKRDQQTKLSTLEKMDLNKPGSSKLLYTFPKFDDGGLSSDGFFIKQEGGRKVFFIPLKNSHIIQYDPDLARTSRIITIDQTPPANATVKMGELYTNSSKTLFVNFAAVADLQYVYVLSSATAKDDEVTSYAIDLYYINNGKYATSIKLPAHKGKGASLMDKSGDALYIAYENETVQFKLSGL